MGWRAYTLVGFSLVLVLALVYRAYQSDNSASISFEAGPELTLPSSDELGLDSEVASEAFVPSTSPVVPYDNKELDRDRLSPEELQAQIELAQQRLQQVERRNLDRQRQVERVFAQAGEAHDSLVHAEVAYQVRAWLDARKTGDTTKYFSYYSEGFAPSSDLSIEKWKQQKIAEIREYQGQEVKLDDIQIEIDDSNEKVLVRFIQSQSSQPKFQSRLVFEKNAGRWLIVSER